MYSLYAVCNVSVRVVVYRECEKLPENIIPCKFSMGKLVGVVSYDDVRE